MGTKAATFDHLLEEEEENFYEIVQAKDDELKRQKKERKRERKEKKKEKKAAKRKESKIDPNESETDCSLGIDATPGEQADQDMMAMMGFSGFDGGNKN